jgi:hypothetical protein
MQMKALLDISVQRREKMGGKPACAYRPKAIEKGEEE